MQAPDRKVSSLVMTVNVPDQMSCGPISSKTLEMQCSGLMQPMEVTHVFLRGKDQGGSGWHQKAIQAVFFIYPWQLSTDDFLPAGTVLLDGKTAREAFTGYVIPQVSLPCRRVCLKDNEPEGTGSPSHLPILHRSVSQV